MLKDAKVFHCSNGLIMFAATLHCALDDLLNRPGAWDEIRFMVLNFRSSDFYRLHEMLVGYSSTSVSDKVSQTDIERIILRGKLDIFN